ncbi:hypothetical protein RB600_001601 [Gaeumannomyces tritici]
MASICLASCDSLDIPLDDKLFERATSIYNNLPEVLTQPSIDEHLNFFGNLVLSHGVQDVIGFHLPHSHYPIPDNTILLGTNINVRGTNVEALIRRWAKPTPIEDVRGKQIHGHIYVVRSDGSLHPYEFQLGHAPDLSGIDLSHFLRDFAKAVKEKGLQKLIALEVLDPENTDRTLYEFIVNRVNHVLVDASMAKELVQTRTTGWTIRDEGNGGVRVLKNTAYAPPKEKGDSHIVYTDGKPDAKLETVSELARALAHVTGN